jgi:hypothetical protein
MCPSTRGMCSIPTLENIDDLMILIKAKSQDLPIGIIVNEADAERS